LAGLEAEGAIGREAVGIGGFPGFVALGLAARGGAVGFGLVATGGGGFLAKELDGREFAGEPSEEIVFFQGVAEPFPGTIPGKTETGLADASAVKDCATGLEAADGVGFMAAGGATDLLGGGGGVGVDLAGAGSK